MSNDNNFSRSCIGPPRFCFCVLLVDSSVSRSMQSLSAVDIFCGAKPLKPGQSCNLALRVPKTRPSTDQAIANQRVRIRSAMVNLIDHCWKNPMQALDIWSSVDSKCIGTAESNSPRATKGSLPTVGTELWWAQRTSFGKLPNEFFANFYAGRENGPAKATLDNMDARDPESIRDAFENHLQLGMKDPIPKELQNYSIMKRFLDFRLPQVGNRQIGWFANSVMDDGSVNWTKKPLWGLEWDDEEGRLDAIVHVPSGHKAVVPEHVLITRHFQFVNMHSDRRSLFSLPPARHFCIDLFGANQGPNLHMVDKKGKNLKVLIDRAVHAQKLQDAEARAGASTDAPILSSRADAIRRNALQKAREAANNRPKRARTMDFAPAVAVAPS